MNTIDLLQRLRGMAQSKTANLLNMEWEVLAACLDKELEIRKDVFSQNQKKTIEDKQLNIVDEIEKASSQKDYDRIDAYLAELMGMMEAMPVVENFYEMVQRQANATVNDDLVYYVDLLCRRTSQLLYYRNLERNTTGRIGDRSDEASAVRFSGRGCVFTVIIGGYDTVWEPECVNDDWDYILFTDRSDVKSQKWEIRQVENATGLDAAKWSRLFKILAHEYLSEYDYSIYVDGNMQIIGDIKDYIARYSLGAPMLCANHYLNMDLYQEAETCVNKQKDNEERIRLQIDRYRTAGMPEEYGMTSNGFMIRDHRDDVLKKVMNDWWNEVAMMSCRDQISLMYCCWKNGLRYDTSDIYIMDNPYVRIYEHCG